jgi:hypothetical protein
LLPFRNRTSAFSGFYRNNALDKIAETFFLLPFRNRTSAFSGFYRNNALDKIEETEVDTPQDEKQKSQ